MTGPDPAPAPDAALAALVRESGRDVLATLARQVGDLGLAEDAVQDAVVRALEVWPHDGVPPNPVGWLRLVARGRAIDLLRQSRSRGEREERAVAEDPGLRPGWTEEVEPSVLDDDLLRLLFTCCHPSLAPASRVALALRTLCGLSEPDIARALLSTPDAVAKRLVRTRQKIKQAGIPYAVPPDHELPDRWEGVLTTVHLVLNEGYAATSGPDLTRPALVAESLRLARLLVRLQPDGPGALGLLALGLLQDSRRATRLGADGTPVLLPDQDRSQWDTTRSARGSSCSVRRCGGPATVRTASSRRPRSRRATRWLRTGRTPTGEPSSPGTTCWLPWTPPPSSRSTGPWRSASGTVPPRGWLLSTRCAAWTPTPTSTPRARCCCAGSVATTRQPPPMRSPPPSVSATPRGRCSTPG